MSIKDAQPLFYDWQTPPEELDRVRSVGTIYLDPCTAPSNPTGALCFYSPQPPMTGAQLGGLSMLGRSWLGPCGLAGSWAREPHELAFVNPRYGRFLSGPIEPDREVFSGERLIGRGTGWAARFALDTGHAIGLVPYAPDASWWRAMEIASDWRVDTSYRIAFFDPRTGRIQRGNKGGSTWFYRAPRCGSLAHYVDLFRSAFDRGTDAPAGDLRRRAWRTFFEVGFEP